MRYAVVEKNIVVNIVKADTPLQDNWIEAKGANIGDTWNGEDFISPTPPEPSIEQIKQEAQLRIVAICPEWKQNNLNRLAAVLSEKGRENWTEQDEADWNDAQLMWDQIDDIRSTSNVLEATEPRPSDFREDYHWQ